MRVPRSAKVTIARRRNRRAAVYSACECTPAGENGEDESVADSPLVCASATPASVARGRHGSLCCAEESLLLLLVLYKCYDRRSSRGSIDRCFSLL